MTEKITMISLWRNDANRKINDRIKHLLEKNREGLRYLWVVGDSTDHTEDILRWTAEHHDNIVVLRYDTMIVGEDLVTRWERLSACVNAAFAAVRKEDDYVIVHESDIISPEDIVDKLVNHAREGRCPIAAWPMLGLVFYDVWAYRAYNNDGKLTHFKNNYPYHDVYKPDEPFRVMSCGTLWILHAKDARWIRVVDRAVVEVCDILTTNGAQIWVDPTIIVAQPKDLWESWEWK